MGDKRDRVPWFRFDPLRRKAHEERLGHERYVEFQELVTRAISLEWEAYKKGAGLEELDAMDALAMAAGDEDPIRKEEETVQDDDTRITGRRVDTLRLSVPLVTDATIAESATWDMAEGVVDALIAASAGDGPTAARARARARKRRAQGEDVRADALEYQMGRAIGEALVDVMLDRELAAEDWFSLVPRALPSVQAVVRPEILDAPIPVQPTRRSILDILRTSPQARDAARQLGQAGGRVLGEAARRSAAERFGDGVGGAAGVVAEGAASVLTDLFTGSDDPDPSR